MVFDVCCRCQGWIRGVLLVAGDVLEDMARVPWSFRFSFGAEMWCQERLPVKGMVVERNVGGEGGVIGEVGRTGESMPRFDLCFSTTLEFV